MEWAVAHSCDSASDACLRKSGGHTHPFGGAYEHSGSEEGSALTGIQKSIAVVVAVLCLSAAAVFVVRTHRSLESGVGSVSVRHGRDAQIVSPNGNIQVNVPGDSIRGDGKLSISPATRTDGTTGWQIEIGSGASLKGLAEIKFKVPQKEKSAPPPLVTYSSTPTGPLSPATSVDVEGAYASVTTNHFSVWFVTWFGDLLDHTRNFMDALSRPVADSKQPRCENEQAARNAVAATSDKGTRVMWCVGLESEAPVLTVTNARGYAVAFESTPGLSVDRKDADPVSLQLASVIKAVPTRRSNSVILVGAGNSVTFKIRDVRRVRDQVRVQPSPPGYLFSALNFASDTVVMLLDKAGLSRRKAAVLAAMKSSACAAGFHDMVTSGIPASPMEASDQLRESLSSALGCAKIAMSDLGLGAFAEELIDGLLWLSSGVKNALNGFGAAADSLLNPSGYAITLTHLKAGAERSPTAGLSSESDSARSTFDSVDESTTAVLGTAASHRRYRLSIPNADRNGFTLRVGSAKVPGQAWEATFESDCSLNAEGHYRCRTNTGDNRALREPVLTIRGEYLVVLSGASENPTARILAAKSGDEVGVFQCPDVPWEGHVADPSGVHSRLWASYVADSGVNFDCETFYPYDAGYEVHESSNRHEHLLEFTGDVIDEPDNQRG